MAKTFDWLASNHALNLRFRDLSLSEHTTCFNKLNPCLGPLSFLKKVGVLVAHQD